MLALLAMPHQARAGSCNARSFSVGFAAPAVVVPAQQFVQVNPALGSFGFAAVFNRFEAGFGTANVNVNVFKRGFLLPWRHR
jgi:hypothetical protein